MLPHICPIIHHPHPAMQTIYQSGLDLRPGKLLGAIFTRVRWLLACEVGESQETDTGREDIGTSNNLSGLTSIAFFDVASEVRVSEKEGHGEVFFSSAYWGSNWSGVRGFF